MAQQLGGRVVNSTIASSATPKSRASPQQTARRGVRSPGRAGPRRARRLDEPWRQGGYCRRVSPPSRRAPTRLWPPWPTSRASSTPCSSIPKSRTRCRASNCSSASCARSRLRAAVERRQHHRRRHRRVRAQVGKGKVLLGCRRRGFLGGRGAAAQGHRRPAGVRVRGSRPHAPQRGRPGHEDLRRQSRREGHPRGCRARFLDALRGETDPERSARSSAPCS